jgi:hypothetical protein
VNKTSPGGSIQSPGTGKKLKNAAEDQLNGKRNPGEPCSSCLGKVGNASRAAVSSRLALPAS